MFSFCEVEQAPSGFSAPYVIALVALEEGPLVAAQLTDVAVHEVKIGMPVEATTRRLGVSGSGDEGLVLYGYKFRPPIARERSRE